MKSLKETIGCAVQASNLTSVEDEERAVDQVQAFGLAQVVRPDRRNMGELNPVTDLAALLWRAQYALDRKAEQSARPILRELLRARGARQRWRAAPGVLDRLAGQLISEAVHFRCHHCFGRGRIAMDDEGRRLRIVPRGTKTAFCASCKGTGRRHASDTDRAKALGVPFEVYRRHWATRFATLQDELAAISGRITSPLAQQLGRWPLR